MERRAFIHTTLATGTLAATGAISAADSSQSEYYELRTYTLATSKLGLLDDYLKQAFIPAMKRLKFGPIGVFAEAPEGDKQRMFVLIVHPSAESCVTLNSRLTADDEHLKAGQEYFAATAADPTYIRVDSSLMVPFEGMPRLVPVDAKKPRVFELRTYESHNERAGRKKIEMFNKAEMAIFQRVGLTPMFFSQTIIGGAMPNLTYLLVFPDENTRTAAWNKFRGDPEWLKLKAMPEYADSEIVSKITKRVLSPRPYSEL